MLKRQSTVFLRVAKLENERLLTCGDSHLLSNSAFTPICRELHTIVDGMGSKLSRIISSITCFVCGYVAGFIFCWDLTFILLASLPLIVTCAIFMSKVGSCSMKIDRICKIYENTHFICREMLIWLVLRK